MINFKREYIGLEQDRLLYPVSFKDKSKCNVYGRKKFITEAGEEQLSAHVFLISKDFWTFNAGQLDFTNYPNGIWNDYISIDIIEKDEYTAPSINFGSMGDITPENLQGLSDYISKHLSDLEKRIVEDYLFIDEGVSENIELPNLPENHFWARRNGVIVGVNLDYLKADYEHLKNELWKNYESFNEKLQATLKKYYDDLELQMNNFFKDLIEKIREEAEKQLGLIAGAGGGLLHKIEQANHGFIFDPIVYENGVWKKATTTSGVDGIGVVISANTFFFLEAGEIEIPKGATDKDGQPLLDDEYYYMNEDGGTGFQKEEPVWFYQPLFHTRTYKGKLLANVHIDTMEDLRGQVVDTESGRTHGIALWGDIVPKFDTIEKLQKAFWLKEGEVVEVLGYYSAGDGAGHKRIIKAEDDGSGVQLSNGLWACIVHNGEVNVSWFGGAYNSNSKSSQNYQALIKALNTGGCVIISQDYYIEQSGNNIINNNFVLKGENKATLYINIKNRENFFKINSNIKKLYLQNLKIILESSVYDGTLFVIKENIFIEDVNILNNYINFKFNKGLFLEWRGINNLETLKKTGSNYIFINNNVFENTFNSFIVMEDIIFKKLEFSNNTVHNFKRNFLCSDLNYADLNLRPIIIIENNIVTNDDDCFFDETYSGLYYVFILVTAKNVYYRNNIVSGMKSNKNVALYNAYVIADEYFCENNTWKNNLCFSIDKENDELMKAKATLKKHFKYNTFLIEDEFIKKFSVSEKAQWVNLHHVLTATTSELTEISNNYINVPELKLYSGAEDVGNFIFKNNNIKCLRFSENILPYPKALNKSSDYLVINNDFDLGVSQTDSTSFYREIGKVKYNSITITGNIIKTNVLDGKDFYGFYGELNSKVCTIKDNTFIQELDTLKSTGVFNPVQSYSNFKAERLFFNNFYSIANIRYYRCSIIPDLSPSSHNFNFELKIAYENSMINLFRFDNLNMLADDKYDYNIIFDFDNKEKTKLLFSIEKKQNAYYFKYYNSLGETQETLIDSTNKINMYLLDDFNKVTNQYIQYVHADEGNQFIFDKTKNYKVLNLKVYIY